jgi:hypothetical protein
LLSTRSRETASPANPEPRKNKSEKVAYSLSLKSRRQKHHDLPPIHHDFTIKMPRYFAAFLENPLKNDLSTAYLIFIYQPPFRRNTHEPPKFSRSNRHLGRCRCAATIL